MAAAAVPVVLVVVIAVGVGLESDGFVVAAAVAAGHVAHIDIGAAGSPILFVAGPAVIAAALAVVMAAR